MNRKKYCITFCCFVVLLFCASIAKSQQGIINYKLTLNDKILKQRREENLITYFNKSSSLELIVNPKKVVKDAKEDELNVVKIIKTGKPYFVYKSFSQKRLILSDYIFNKKYVINDSLNNFKWKITNDRSRIQNFNCRKAIIIFRGRSYEAWYTDDIPIQNGPWKFCGLPGLIVKVKDANSDFVYELTGINLKTKFDNKIISIPSNYEKDKPVSYREFRALYVKKLDELLKLSRVEQVTPDGVAGKVSITLPEKQEKF